jgi:prevent-host-death family protein
MKYVITASEARRKFGEVLRRVADGESVMIERNGKPAAAIMPVEAYRQWQRRNLADKMRAMAERICTRKRQMHWLKKR